ncbi:hypothetical protein Tco_0222745 [Tanacetum coccineum]
MEEIVNKFIEEGKREQEEIEAFIREFRTTNELLLKERNNSLSKLEFKIYELSRAINKAQMVGYKAKGVTIRGGKSITEPISDNNNTNKHPLPIHEEPTTLEKIPTNTKPRTNYRTTTIIDTFSSQYAKFLKGLLSNKTRLEEACTVTMNERCSVVLLNKLPSKEKDQGSFTIPCDIGHLHIDNALADLGANMREDSRIPILGRPFLATARAMIDVFNKKITLRVGSEEVIFNVDQSMKKSRTEDDECYGIDDLDTVIQSATQELLENDRLNENLEEDIGQHDLEKCDSDSETPIRRIKPINTPYSQETQGHNITQNEHLYFASAI